MMEVLKNFYFLIEGKLLYNVVLVSVVQQHESALSIHISLFLLNLSTLPTSHPFRSSKSTELGPVLFSNFSLAMYLIHDGHIP